MTQYFNFTPSPVSPFQFQPTLDGANYNCIVAWNIFGQRWYVGIYDLQNNLIVNIPMIGSPPDYNISLTNGYFQSTMIFSVANNRFEVYP
jgi:hypothetical protein